MLLVGQYTVFSSKAPYNNNTHEFFEISKPYKRCLEISRNPQSKNPLTSYSNVERGATYIIHEIWVSSAF